MSSAGPEWQGWKLGVLAGPPAKAGGGGAACASAAGPQNAGASRLGLQFSCPPGSLLASPQQHLQARLEGDVGPVDVSVMPSSPGSFRAAGAREEPEVTARLNVTVFKAWLKVSPLRTPPQTAEVPAGLLRADLSTCWSLGGLGPHLGVKLWLRHQSWGSDDGPNAVPVRAACALPTATG